MKALYLIRFQLDFHQCWDTLWYRTTSFWILSSHKSAPCFKSHWNAVVFCHYRCHRGADLLEAFSNSETCGTRSGLCEGWSGCLQANDAMRSCVRLAASGRVLSWSKATPSLSMPPRLSFWIARHNFFKVLQSYVETFLCCHLAKKAQTTLPSRPKTWYSWFSELTSSAWTSS